MQGEKFMIKIDEIAIKCLCATTLSLGLGCLLLLVGCPEDQNKEPGGPIAKEVYTTAEQQIRPFAMPAGTPLLNQAEIHLRL